ncbi:MAG: glutamate formiminotransferase [Acidimicrobiia bacterium]|nr:glutamate formiminotransferase [Acidimicrobiia bacterium]
MLEAVINVSEGRDDRIIDAIGGAAGRTLLDVHRDPDHHRSVFTLAASDPGTTEAAARRLAGVALADLDINRHDGVHPRVGILDVVPFVALDPTPDDIAGRAATAFGHWLASVHAVPVFFYGGASPEGHDLPTIRSGAFTFIAPDCGPSTPHPRFGATVVGSRPPLIAVNVELESRDLSAARRIAGAVRERDGGLPGVRTLGLALPTADAVQVSMNLVDLPATGIEVACRTVADQARQLGIEVRRIELVGLMPASEFRRCSAEFLAWAGLTEAATVEARAR